MKAKLEQLLEEIKSECNCHVDDPDPYLSDLGYAWQSAKQDLAQDILMLIQQAEK